MNRFREKIREALNLMKWTSELSYLVNPIPENSYVVNTLEKLLEFA